MAIMHSHDFLSACTGTGTHNKTLEEIRDKGAEVILATFRMMKNSLVHAMDNNAVLKTVHETHALLAAFSSVVGGEVNLSFGADSIFVCGQLLRATRSIYDSAREAGQMLAALGVSELSFSEQVSESDLLAFCSVFSTASRDPKQRGLLLATPLVHIEVARGGARSSAVDEELSTANHHLHMYVNSVAVMREVIATGAHGQDVPLRRIKRVAQTLVTLAEQQTDVARDLVSMPHGRGDDATRAVLTALVASLLGQQLTARRKAPLQLAMAALLLDAGGEQEVVDHGSHNEITLEGDSMPPEDKGLSARLIASGGVYFEHALRTVVVEEVEHLQDVTRSQPPQVHGASPLFHSRLLHVARNLVERLMPRDHSEAQTPAEALAQLVHSRKADSTALHLLAQALGLPAES